MERIPVSGPSITQREIDHVTDAVANGWFENHNLYQTRFELAFAAYVGRKHAVALPSCTSAIHLSLAALRIGPGDEVIVPDITWIASAAPILYVGATPVFADIDPKSWCLSVESLEEHISPKTRAVIPVDLYGNMPDMEGIRTAAERHDIAVIEDAAQAIGSEYNGKKAGCFGTTSTFSFHGTKTITTGEGGMLVTDDDEIYKRCRFLADHGRALGEKMFWNTEVAYKYKMSCLQAALGIAQLERVEELVAKKRTIFSWYRSHLADVPGLTLNSENPEIKNSYWMVTAVMAPGSGVTKEMFIKRLDENNISCRPFFYPLSSLPAFAHLEHAERGRANTNAYCISPYAVNLPSGLNLSEDNVHRVCDCLKRILTTDL
jgi:perosamine synthetase